MNIAVVGASAGVGLLTVKRALERGHKVTALSRSGMQIQPNANLISVTGSATVAEDVKRVIQNADAVIVTIGTGKSTKATTLYTDAAAALIQAQKELQTKIPFIVLTGFGTGESGKYHGWVMKILFSLLLKKVYENKTKMEEMIAASDMQWEIVRPGMLTDNPLSEKYRVEINYYKGMNIGSISRNDVADYLVKEAEKPTALFEYAALSGK